MSSKPPKRSVEQPSKDYIITPKKMKPNFGFRKFFDEERSK